jgi:hypothetical protein
MMKSLLLLANTTWMGGRFFPCSRGCVSANKKTSFDPKSISLFKRKIPMRRIIDREFTSSYQYLEMCGFQLSEAGEKRVCWAGMVTVNL